MASPADRERPVGNPHALRIGGIVVGITLVGFVGGTAIGIEPWVVAVVADLALVTILRRTPVRDIPFGTAIVALPAIDQGVTPALWAGLPAGIARAACFPLLNEVA